MELPADLDFDELATTTEPDQLAFRRGDVRGWLWKVEGQMNCYRVTDGKVWAEFSWPVEALADVGMLDEIIATFRSLTSHLAPPEG
jgi:hypothetical protein